MLTFNHTGYLIPDKNIVSSLDEVKETFLFNDTRRKLFEKYLIYSNSLKGLCQQEYLQWLNGSFSTLTSEPGDIDIISFIPSSLIKANETLFRKFSYPNSELEYGVDAYIVKVYPEMDRHYNHYIADKMYWVEKFSTTKINRAGKKAPKGFVEINF